MEKNYLFMFLVFIFCIVILTGCESKNDINKIECTLSYDNQSQLYIGELDKNDNVTNVTLKLIYENEEQAKSDLERVKSVYGKYAELDGNKINLSNLKGHEIYDETVGKSKDYFKKLVYLQKPLDSSGELSCK